MWPNSSSQSYFDNLFAPYCQDQQQTSEKLQHPFSSTHGPNSPSFFSHFNNTTFALANFQQGHSQRYHLPFSAVHQTSSNNYLSSLEASSRTVQQESCGKVDLSQTKTKCCAKCQNHKLFIPMKFHKCEFQNCSCKKCALTAKRRSWFRQHNRQKYRDFVKLKKQATTSACSALIAQNLIQMTLSDSLPPIHQKFEKQNILGASGSYFPAANNTQISSENDEVLMSN